MTEPADTLDVAAAASAEAPGDDPLRAFLSGKRQGERFACQVPAVLEGLLAPVAATLYDVSATGALVQIDEAAFLEAEEQGGTQAYLELLSLHARNGLKLRVAGHGVELPVEVVRWTAGEAGQGVSRVGLRFTQSLADAELAALRSGSPGPLPLSAAESPALDEAVETLPLVPRRGAKLDAFVFRAGQPEAGPVVAGRLLGAGPHGVALRLDGRRPLVEVAGLLAGHALEIELRESGRVLHTSTSHVAWILPVSAGGAVDVGLHVDTDLPRAATKRLRGA